MKNGFLVEGFLRDLRLCRFLKRERQIDVAKNVLGCSVPTYSRKEAGYSPLTFPEFQALCDHFAEEFIAIKSEYFSELFTGQGRVRKNEADNKAHGLRVKP
jgi:hypothetical protein